MNKILLSGLVMSVVAPSVSFAEGCSSSGMYVALSVGESFNKNRVKNINDAKLLEEIVSGLNEGQKISDLAKQDTNTAKIIISALQEVEKPDSIQEDTTVNDVRDEILEGISMMIKNGNQDLYKNIPSDGKFTFSDGENVESHVVKNKINKTKGKVTADLTVGYEFVTDSSLIFGVSGSFGTDFGKQKIDVSKDSKDKKSLSTLTVKNLFNIGLTPYIGYKFNDTVDLCLLFGINMGRNKITSLGLALPKDNFKKTSFSPVIGLASKINFGNGLFAILSFKTLLNAKIATVKKNGIDVKQNSYKFTAGIGMRF